MAKRKRFAPRDPLLLEIAAAIGAGGITIGPIHSDTQRIHGQIEGAKIRINPAIEMADTAIHEVIHRLRPHWSELAVRSRTAKIMRQLSDKEIDKIYELVLTTARVSKTAIIND